ncbi:MAG: hypothetical protein BGO64_18455 [Aeromonas sp. 62-46]|nr:MAG: hypothetical protein BGO64_18455 [Aeromonas sp. 62-46]
MDLLCQRQSIILELGVSFLFMWRDWVMDQRLDTLLRQPLLQLITYPATYNKQVPYMCTFMFHTW